MLWEIWHPNYGMLFDEYENIKNGKYSFLTIAGRVQVIEKEVVPFSPPPGSHLSLFPMPA